MIVRHNVYVCDVCNAKERAGENSYGQPPGWSQVIVERENHAEPTEEIIKNACSTRCLRLTLIRIANEVPQEEP
jgi:hypothetical protein